MKESVRDQLVLRLRVSEGEKEVGGTCMCVCVCMHACVHVCMHACVLGISRSSCVFFVGDHSLDLQACIHVYTFV